jgi:diacylglycerol kinase
MKKRLLSFKYAGQGIWTLFSTQPNARIHLFVLLLVVGMGIGYSISITEWLILVLTFGVVLTAEAFNTALEFLTDLVSPEPHPLAGKAKDVAAGAVLISAIMAVVVGLIIFLPKIFF